MGTSWTVSYWTQGEPPAQDLIQAGIAQRVERIEQSMSTYRQDSEISRFNAHPVGEWFPLSDDMNRVLVAALAVGESSRGRYDITVGPLVDLWGFGASAARWEPPAAAAIAEALHQVGQSGLQHDAQSRRLLKTSALRIDLSSIAKGYAVDVVSDWLSSQGLVNTLVEIGGEMRVSGLSARGDAWRVAVEQPVPRQRQVATTLALSDLAIATSGDYRNYFEHQGQRYSHTIDPLTGRPVQHDTVSVTVVHPSAMLADAWATALTVLGREEGLQVAREAGLRLYLMERDGVGFASHASADLLPLFFPRPPANLQPAQSPEGT